MIHPVRRRRRGRYARALKWFRPGIDGTLLLKNSYVDDAPKRLALVQTLTGLLSSRSNGAVQTEPALEALLIGEIKRLKRKLEHAPTATQLKTAIKGLKRALYPYQRQGVERFLADGRLLLADDMGLGKTAQAIASADILRRLRRVRRGLIIAPASLKPQWAREWALFSDLPVAIIDGSPAERRALYESGEEGFFIINYEQLIKDLEPIRRWDPELVVLDEAQRIKNWATKTALSVKGLVPAYRLVLTGTPMENRIEELASVVEWVNDMALEPKWRLSALHSVHADGRREVTGVRNLDTLRDRLRGCMLRRVREDVLDQLPPRTDTRVPVEMTEAQLEEHDALIQPILSLVQRSKLRPLKQAEFLRLMSLLTTQRIISNGLAQLRFQELWPTLRTRASDEMELTIAGLSSPKLLELRRLTRQLVLEQNRKVVVFSQWRRMLSLSQWAVSDLLADRGLRCGFFTGAEGQKRRTQNIVEFHDDPACRLLFASDAGGVGLNLQHASNCVINLELPWNPAVLEQRIGRIYRLGQKQPIDVYNLVSEEGIESRIAGLVGSKQAFFKGLFDGESDSVQFNESASFLSKVEKICLPAPDMDSVASAGADDLQETDPGDFDIDDEVADPFDQLIEAADEAGESIAAAVENEPVETRSLPRSEPAAEIDEPRADRDDRARPASPTIGDVRQLFSRLQIRRRSNGNVVIEAEPEDASVLGDLFEGMAALLQSAARSTDRADTPD